MLIYFYENDKLKPLDKMVEFPKNSNKPLVLLLGWSGSSIGPLSKYCDIYIKNGFNCLILCSPIDPTTFLLRKNTLTLLDALSEYIIRNPQTLNVITHSFSVGGVCTSWLFHKIFTNKEYKFLIPYFQSTAIIMDSGAPCTIKGALYGYFYTMKKFSSFTLVLSPLLLLLAPIYFHAFKVYYPQLIDPKKKNFSLVFNSKEDRVLGDNVGKFIKDLKEKNGEEYAKSIDFYDSEHVNHFKKYKDKYNFEIQLLINKLKLQNKITNTNIISKL